MEDGEFQEIGMEWNSVLNSVGKSAIFILNRVRVWVAEPHLSTQG